jgi:capsular exopolysaccharide synthesis family protein
MGKTYEALVKSEKEYPEKLLMRSKPEQKSLVPLPYNQQPKLRIPEQYKELRNKLQTYYQDGSIKTIMFTSTAAGEGVTTTVAFFAYCLTQTFLHNVLLIDTNLKSPRIHRLFDLEHSGCLDDVFSKECRIECQSNNESSGNLFVITYDGNSRDSLSMVDLKRFKEFLATMRDRFDFILLDSPPLNLFSEALTIGSVVDGVMLVVEAGKTRQQTALKAKEELEAAGGKFLGVVLNKREYFIPKWIYRRL